MSTRESSKSRLSCPSCAAPVDPRDAACNFCGTRLAGEEHDDERHRACAAFLRAMDKDIKELATPRVVLGFLAFFAAIPAAYFGARFFGAALGEAILITVAVGVAGMVAAGVNLTAEENRRFRTVLRPQIDAFLERHSMSRGELLVIAGDTLPKGSSIMRHLDDLYGR